MQVDNEADADIVVIPYWVDLLCRMSQESELLWDEFNKARPPPFQTMCPLITQDASGAHPKL